MTPYDWKQDLTDEEIARVRRRNLADLAAACRDACDELHKLLREPPQTAAPHTGHIVQSGSTVPCAGGSGLTIAYDPRDST